MLLSGQRGAYTKADMNEHHSAPRLSRARLLTIAATLLVSVFASSPVSAARVGPNQSTTHLVRFAGQVTAVTGPTTNPDGFTLQLRDHAVVIKILPRTNIIARSAEAQVEGFGPYVFAVVTAAKVGADWTANRVEYDVVPFGPIRDFAVTGKTTWVDKKGHAFRLRLMSGDIRTVRITKQTRFEFDGQPAEDAPPTLAVGEALDVSIHRNLQDQWIAVLIDIRSAPPGH